jgi:hypothetical protein
MHVTTAPEMMNRSPWNSKLIQNTFKVAFLQRVYRQTPWRFVTCRPLEGRKNP